MNLKKLLIYSLATLALSGKVNSQGMESLVNKETHKTSISLFRSYASKTPYLYNYDINQYENIFNNESKRMDAEYVSKLDELLKNYPEYRIKIDF